MRPFLLTMLRCPACRGNLTPEVFANDPDSGEASEGLLLCGCGASFPIVNTIPRMLLNAYDLFPGFAARHDVRIARRRRRSMASKLERTRESFGYQWTTFSDMTCDFKENFWNYLYPATPELLAGKVGLDVGCGFGRHLYQAAHHCSDVVGIDLSRAVDAAYQNTKQLPNVHLVQGDIYALPFAPRTFDVIYSVGVLHHLPDPETGVRQLAPLLRPDGWLFIWLYSKQRRMMNFLLECLRVVTTRLPYAVLRHAAWLGAAIDYGLCVRPYRWLRQRSRSGRLIERLTPQRIKVYSVYPFQVLHADWFDRLAAPIRYYYDEEEVRTLMQQAGCSEICVSQTGLYGWRACGKRIGSPSAVPS